MYNNSRFKINHEMQEKMQGKQSNQPSLMSAQAKQYLDNRCFVTF